MSLAHIALITDRFLKLDEWTPILHWTNQIVVNRIDIAANNRTINNDETDKLYYNCNISRQNIFNILQKKYTMHMNFQEKLLILVYYCVTYFFSGASDAFCVEKFRINRVFSIYNKIDWSILSR